ncbi:hypothetical protein DFA_01695 [Cavenderia fasciculata]|uniref:Uncharacterized protein n=1 Tax=Cavenderia fasciculata TaxID=261658 RepID=F4PU94_CACFS|nr:uncharacterized protein DFA_01695 [Cavenderia fasciculata]EGG21809.1 hypothetical protein DFA_01695 [Cavenderia fasciculata]|eukprot:XP_004359659.1 hypothetical protein DFA_01695 [Cavenderia fasciculata]
MKIEKPLSLGIEEEEGGYSISQLADSAKGSKKTGGKKIRSFKIFNLLIMSNGGDVNDVVVVVVDVVYCTVHDVTKDEQQ